MKLNVDTEFGSLYDLLDSFPCQFYQLIKDLNFINTEFNIRYNNFNFNVTDLGSVHGSDIEHGFSSNAYKFEITEGSRVVFEIQFIKHPNNNTDIQKLIYSSISKSGTTSIINREYFIFPNATSYIYNYTLYEGSKYDNVIIYTKSLMNLIRSKMF